MFHVFPARRREPHRRPSRSRHPQQPGAVVGRRPRRKYVARADRGRSLRVPLLRLVGTWRPDEGEEASGRASRDRRSVAPGGTADIRCRLAFRGAPPVRHAGGSVVDSSAVRRAWRARLRVEGTHFRPSSASASARKGKQNAERTVGSAFRGVVAQLVRAPPCHGGGRGFEPHQRRHPAHGKPSRNQVSLSACSRDAVRLASAA